MQPERLLKRLSQLASEIDRARRSTDHAGAMRLVELARRTTLAHRKAIDSLGVRGRQAVSQLLEQCGEVERTLEQELGALSDALSRVSSVRRLLNNQTRSAPVPRLDTTS